MAAPMCSRETAYDRQLPITVTYCRCTYLSNALSAFRSVCVRAVIKTFLMELPWHNVVI